MSSSSSCLPDELADNVGNGHHFGAADAFTDGQAAQYAVLLLLNAYLRHAPNGMKVLPSMVISRMTSGA
jgi:hypothetical protein